MMEIETIDEELMDIKTEEDCDPINENSLKKRRVVRTTIKFKKEIIEKFESGARVTDLSKEYNMPRSTISSILKNREPIKAANVAKGVKSLVKQRPQILEEVEKLLFIWVNKKQLGGDTISAAMICKKAKQLHADLSNASLTTKISDHDTFKASRGWYENFKKRSGICRVRKTADVEKKSAERFANNFKNFVNAEKFFPQQVFTCSETSLFWKKLPKKTFIAQEEMASPGPRPMNNKITLLLCSNASGDLKLKPLLVYHSENPRVFRKCHVTKGELPVLWRTHSKGWITKQFFIEWMKNVFSPTVKFYLLEKNLPLRALFLLDNAPTHPMDLENSLHDEFNFITVRFLPSDISPLLRPINEKVISNFKTLYVKALLQSCVSIVTNTELSLEKYWKKHLNIIHCIQLIDKAWDEVSNCRLNSGWKNLWPEGVFKTEFEILETETANTMKEILSMSQILNLDLNENNVEELLLDTKKELTTNELQELLKEQEKLISVEISTDAEETEKLSISLLQDICVKWAEVRKFVEKHHPDKALASKLTSQMNYHIFTYFREILNAKKIN